MNESELEPRAGLSLWRRRQEVSRWLVRPRPLPVIDSICHRAAAEERALTPGERRESAPLFMSSFHNRGQEEGESNPSISGDSQPSAVINHL